MTDFLTENPQQTTEQTPSETPTENTGSTGGSLPEGDSPTAGFSQQADTRSPEYQINVMQQRIKDKDDFIETLKQENQDFRTRISILEEKLQNMEDISEVLSNKGQEQAVSNQDTGLDENELVGKVIESLNQRQTEAARDENFDTVVNTLTEQFGKDNVNSKVQQYAQELGMSVDDMKETARKSPQAFYRLTGIESTKSQAPQSPQPTHSNVNSQAMPNTGEKDHSYYMHLMRNNPREFWKPEVQREYRKLFSFNQAN